MDAFELVETELLPLTGEQRAEVLRRLRDVGLIQLDEWMVKARVALLGARGADRAQGARSVGEEAGSRVPFHRACERRRGREADGCACRAHRGGGSGRQRRRLRRLQGEAMQLHVSVTWL